MSHVKLPSPKKAVAFQAYSSLTIDFQDLDNSRSFPLILGGWMAALGTAQLCDGGQETSCFPSPVGWELSLAPCSVRGSSHGAGWDWDLCRSRKSSSSSFPTYLPFASVRGVRGPRPALQLGGCCTYNVFCLLFVLRDDHGAGRWMRIFPWVPPSHWWDQSLELQALDLPLGWRSQAPDGLPY